MEEIEKLAVGGPVGGKTLLSLPTGALALPSENFPLLLSCWLEAISDCVLLSTIQTLCGGERKRSCDFSICIPF